LNEENTPQEFSSNGLQKRSIKNQWLNFEKNEIFLLLSLFFLGTAFANYEPYAPIWLLQIFDVHSFLILGLVSVISSIMYAIGAVFWGVLADKFQTKKFVLLGVVGLLLMFISLIFTQTPVFFLVIILVGFFVGSAQYSNYYVLATKSIKKPKEITLSKISMTMSFSWVVFSPIVARIYENLANSMTIQLIIASGMSLIAFVFAFLIKEGKDEEKENPEEQLTEVSFPENETSRSKITLFPLIFALILFLTFSYQMTGGFWGYTSIYFLDTLGIDPDFYSLFLIIKTILALPLAFLLGKVKRTKNISIIIMISMGWMSMVYLLMTLFPSNWIMILILYSVPMYPLYTIGFYSLVTIFSKYERRATAYGMFNASGTAGYISGIVILGAVADRVATGIESMLRNSLIITSIALSVSILFFVIIRIKRKTVSEVELNNNGKQR